MFELLFHPIMLNIATKYIEEREKLLRSDMFFVILTFGDGPSENMKIYLIVKPFRLVDPESTRSCWFPLRQESFFKKNAKFQKSLAVKILSRDHFL